MAQSPEIEHFCLIFRNYHHAQSLGVVLDRRVVVSQLPVDLAAESVALVTVGAELNVRGDVFDGCGILFHLEECVGPLVEKREAARI